VRPDDLDDLARDAWDRLTSLLKPMGILCKVDRDALVLYAMTFSRWRRAEADLDRAGVTIVDKYGRARANPSATVAKDARATLIKLMNEFGLTPGARAGMRLPPTAGDPHTDFSSKGDDRWGGLFGN
jgi:P27 family predicted phage terminase small subunit